MVCTVNAQTLHASQEPAPRLVPATLRPALARSVTAPHYSTIVSGSLRQTLRRSFSEPRRAPGFAYQTLSDVCLYPRTRARIFEGGCTLRDTTANSHDPPPPSIHEVLWTRIGGESMVGPYAWTSTSGRLNNLRVQATCALDMRSVSQHLRTAGRSASSASYRRTLHAYHSA